MKKLLSGTLAISLLITGCGSGINYSLPDDPIAFETYELINPEHSDEGYMALEYNGRIYIPYGTLSGSIDKDDVKQCLGYEMQDGEEDENVRIYTLSDDSGNNYLMIYNVDGEMEQPDFWRAADTVGENIPTPEFIDGLEYDYWK